MRSLAFLGVLAVTFVLVLSIATYLLRTFAPSLTSVTSTPRPPVFSPLRPDTGAVRMPVSPGVVSPSPPAASNVSLLSEPAAVAPRPSIVASTADDCVWADADDRLSPPHHPVATQSASTANMTSADPTATSATNITQPNRTISIVLLRYPTLLPEDWLYPNLFPCTVPCTVHYDNTWIEGYRTNKRWLRTADILAVYSAMPATYPEPDWYG